VESSWQARSAFPLARNVNSAYRFVVSTLLPAGNRLDTTNIYAEIDLETKARALDACAIKGRKGSQTPWRQQRALMEFLHAL
jgi:hypothetical protein